MQPYSLEVYAIRPLSHGPLEHTELGMERLLATPSPHCHLGICIEQWIWGREHLGIRIRANNRGLGVLFRPLLGPHYEPFGPIMDPLWDPISPYILVCSHPGLNGRMAAGA